MAPYIFEILSNGGISMNKLLTKIANDAMLSKGVIFTGLALSIAGNVITFVGVYYTALRKGVELRDEEYYQEEVRKYEN